MKKLRPQLAAFLLLAAGIVTANAGTIFYQAIPAAQSDANSGISSNYGYTSAVDGGNTRGSDRVINGITLTALVADGQTATADNCTLNALAGNLSNAGGGSPGIQADGVFKDAVSDMTFNNGATDNSQQEIVLDPESLEAGTTYDLRIYVCNSSGQNRQVSLTFVGDGQPAVETGFFNEDDARTSAGGFRDANQAYYINYRFTWDGDSTPGVTITQKSGSAPFVLYALTNQVVSTGAEVAENAEGQSAGEGEGRGQGAGEAAGGEGDEGLSSGFVNTESDEIGVESDDFYGSDSLNSNGKWVNVDKWGKCWQPTNVPTGWCPYTNGTFQNCDDCGATFVSDEPWAWACYHYGRWCKVSYGCGWCWVPGKVWAGSWVSWRRGRTESCSCIGWAPLPPEAGCEIGVGISSWVDETCNIGPDCYTFINVVDFGRDSYFGCGCIYEHSRNSTIIIDTFNCTNICYNQHVCYAGGPDFKWCNEQIRKHGGKECENIHVNRYDDPKELGGKFSKHDGKQLGLVSPHIKGEKNPKFSPKVADHIKSNQIDHGWKNVKDPKVRNNLKNHIAQESKGKNPHNTKATLPTDVAQKLAKHHGSGGGQGLAGAGGGKGQHPGGKGNKGANSQNLTTGGKTGAEAGGFNQHPGGKGKGKGRGTAGAGAGAGAGGTTGFNQHPGGKGHKGKNATGGTNAGMAESQNMGTGGGGKGRHPGQSLKGQSTAGAGTTGAGTSVGGKHKGKGQTGGETGQGFAGATGQGGTTGQGGSGKHKNKGQTSGGTGQGFAGATGQGGTTGQGGSGKHKSKGQTSGGTGQGFAGATGQGGTTGQGGSGKHKNKGQTSGGTGQGFAGATSQGGTTGQGGSGKHKNKGQTGGGTGQGFAGATGQGGGGGGGKHHKQQVQQQQFQQQHVQQQHVQRQGGGGGGAGGGGGGGGGKKGKKSPTPNPALSDLRVKKNVSFVRWSPMGIPIYQFSYIKQPNKRYQGTIAQAITQIRPDAIVWRNGLMFVDYSRLDVEMEELPPPY